jgi:hypothetical protein
MTEQNLTSHATDPTAVTPAEALPIINPFEHLKRDGTVQELTISEGNYVGGDTLVPLDELDPLYSKEAGFNVGGIPSDLMAVIEAGEQYIGIIDTHIERGTGTDYNFDKRRFVIAKMAPYEKDGETFFAVANKSDGRPAIGYSREPDTSHNIGPNTRTLMFEEIGFDFNSDKELSDRHGRFNFTDDGELRIIDEHSFNGLSVLVRPSDPDRTLKRGEVQALKADKERATHNAALAGHIGVVTVNGLIDGVPSSFTKLADQDKGPRFHKAERFKPDFEAARFVDNDELVRHHGNDGKTLSLDYYHNQSEARSHLVDSFNGMYSNTKTFTDAIKRAHELSAANDVYKKVGDGKLGFDASGHGVFRDERRLISKRPDAGKRVAAVAARYGDPYAHQFDSVVPMSKHAMSTPVKLDGIKEDFEAVDVIHYDDDGRVILNELIYPGGDAIDSYMTKMAELGAQFQAEIAKPQPDIQKALELVGRQYQYGAVVRPFWQINNSLFMNLANMQVKMLGLRGMTHGDMDFAAQRMQPKSFVRYFMDRANGREQ